MLASLPRIDVTMHELERVLAQAKEGPLSEEACQQLRAAIHTLGHVARLLQDNETTLSQLRQLLLGPTTEKTRHVLKEAGLDVSALPRRAAPPSTSDAAAGHGRLGADAYAGARRVRIPHAVLKAGDRCPKCLRGKVYAHAEPGLLVRFVGQLPLSATVLRAAPGGPECQSATPIAKA